MNLVKPSKNNVTGKYTATHHGIDYSGNGDTNVYATASGVIEQSINLYVNSWRNTGKLTTRDYGNYIKIKHTDGTYSLYAHLEKDTPLPTGTKVKQGQVIAKIGNTGNSTGRHLHFEYRNSSNINVEPVFEGESMLDDEMVIKKTKFEELVTKSSRWDEVLKEGYTSVAQIKEEIKQLKQSASNAQASERVERERAENARKELVTLIATVAKALNTQQEIGQIEAALVRVDRQLDDLEDLQRQYASLQLSSGEKEEEMRAEIKRLEELIKNSDSLAGASFEQLLSEIIRRFKNILKGHQV